MRGLPADCSYQEEATLPTNTSILTCVHPGHHHRHHRAPHTPKTPSNPQATLTWTRGITDLCHSRPAPRLPALQENGVAHYEPPACASARVGRSRLIPSPADRHPSLSTPAAVNEAPVNSCEQGLTRPRFHFPWVNIQERDCRVPVSVCETLTNGLPGGCATSTPRSLRGTPDHPPLCRHGEGQSLRSQSFCWVCGISPQLSLIGTNGCGKKVRRKGSAVARAHSVLSAVGFGPVAGRAPWQNCSGQGSGGTESSRSWSPNVASGTRTQ